MNKTQTAGNDVSHFQGTVDWPAVKAAGSVFAFAKASDGNTYSDPQFQLNWQAMESAGLLRGAYHFYETNDDPATQAENFLTALGALKENDLPPVVDIESFKGNYGSASIAQNLQIWLNIVQQACDRTPIIYTGTAFWNEYLDAGFAHYPLWIAEYSVSQPTLPNGWTQWSFWQFSESGSTAGVNGAVDSDFFNGSAQDLLTFIQNSQTS